MSDELPLCDKPHSPWDDPTVQAALAEGRQPDDISLVPCEGCRSWVYYNDGSHVSCPWCDWSASGEDLDHLLEEGANITLDDYADLEAEEWDVP